MDFDTAPPIPVADYRHFQTIIPGIDALYTSIGAILNSQLPANADILIIGAGGGREIETLAASPALFRLVGVDPSEKMLDLARSYIPADAEQRVRLIQGYVEDLPEDLTFSAATAVLVMHFLPDDGSKARFLDAIRARLQPGALYIHVDVSIESDLEAETIGSVINFHGASIGFPADIASRPAEFAQAMRRADEHFVVSPTRNRALLEQSGFEIISPFFRSLWFTGWWARAV